jgi:dihydrofolate reductase
MGAVIVAMSISLDGYVAGPNDDPGRLHEWMFGAGASVPGEGLSGVDRELMDELRGSSGALIAGRRLYDITGGWGGSHPFGDIPLFVVSHSVPSDVPVSTTPFTFVTEGVASAVDQARHAAGDKNTYVVGGANVGQQLLGAGLVDELWITVVPVLMGGGVRLFEETGDTSISLDQLSVTSSQVAHLRYKVSRDESITEVDRHGRTRL